MTQGWFQYLQVHLSEADEHPSNEALPKPRRNEAHLYEALQGVVGSLAEAVDVHGRLLGKKVGQQIAMRGGNETFLEISRKAAS